LEHHHPAAGAGKLVRRDRRHRIENIGKERGNAHRVGAKTRKRSRENSRCIPPSLSNAVAAIAPHKLSSTSGGVVMFNDVTIGGDNYTGSIATIGDNALAFVGCARPPTLFIQQANAAAVLVSWNTNYVNFRLQQSAVLSSSNWGNVTLTGPNQAVVPATNSHTFFRLISP